MESSETRSAAPRPASIVVLVGIYLASFAGFVVLLNIVTLFVRFNASAMGFVICMASGGAVARYWAKREQAVPGSGRAWRMAALCGGISALLSLGLLVFGLVGVGRIGHEINAAGPVLATALFVVVIALHMLLVRLGFWLTFRQVAKRLAG